MRSPPALVAFAGHPLVATPILGSGALALYACWQAGEGALLPGLAVAAVMGWVIRAADAVSDYRRWKRAWKQMGGEPRRAFPSKAAAVVSVLAAAGLYVAANPDRPAAVLGAAFIGLGLMVGIAKLATARVAKVLPRASASSVDLVAVRAKPSFPVPTPPAAYSALPAYCRQLIERT